MIKFVQRQVYQIQKFTDQNGISYRTTNGLHWEERVDESWEYVHLDEKLTAAYNRFQSGQDEYLLRIEAQERAKTWKCAAIWSWIILAVSNIYWIIR